MKQCSVVIGSLFGDEGKGHFTDILCSHQNSLNVRFNGGAQASHTVETPDGRRHAFRHFGSGTFSGAITYLSDKFIVNIAAFYKEKEDLLNEFGISPNIIVSPNCIATTPWDVYINQAVEKLRDKNRHGSCGFGINETVERSKNEKYKISVIDFFDERKLVEKLRNIEKFYVKERLKDEYNLTLDDLPISYKELLTRKENVEMFIFFAKEFLYNVQVHGNYIINKFDNVVFEGAQGLLLDESNFIYSPNVTASKTGIKNVMDILQELSFAGKPEIYYMSRSYLTRHGAGFLKGELEKAPYEKIVDDTNIPNEFQGALRFGYLNFDLLASQINKDLTNLVIPANVNIAFTCVDQLDTNFSYIENGILKTAQSKDFLDLSFNILNGRMACLSNMYQTKSPTRESLLSYKKTSSEL